MEIKKDNENNKMEVANKEEDDDVDKVEIVQNVAQIMRNMR